MKDDGNWFRGFFFVVFLDEDEMLVVFGDFSVWIWEIVIGKFVYDIFVKGINVEEMFGYLDVVGDFVVYCLCD